MPNPYDVLGVTALHDDETIRCAYLDLVRRFPPDRSPAEFKRINAAYDSIKDLESRVSFLLFDATQGEPIDETAQEASCPNSAKRISLNQLVRLLGDR